MHPASHFSGEETKVVVGIASHLGIEGGFERALLVRSIIVPPKGRKPLPEPG